MSKTAFEKIAAGLADAISIADEKAHPMDYRVHVSLGVDSPARRKSKKVSEKRADSARRGGLKTKS